MILFRITFVILSTAEFFPKTSIRKYMTAEMKMDIIERIKILSTNILDKTQTIIIAKQPEIIDINPEIFVLL